MKKPPAKKTTSDNSQSRASLPEVTIASRQSWEGPLPPPVALAEFDQVVKNGAERIVAAWEKETTHRHRIEQDELRLVYRDVIWGKILAFIFVIAALGFSAFCAYLGAQWLSGIMGGGVIASVVWAFVKTNNSE